MSNFNFEQAKNYQTPMVSGDVPQCIQSTPVVKPAIKSSVRQVVAISNSGSQTNGGLSQIQIPSANAFLKAGSAYLRFTVSIVRATGATGNTGTNMGFNGACLGDASSLISRLTVQQAGNNLESMLFYPVIEQMFILGRTNAPFLAYELSPVSGCGVTGYGSSSSATTKLEVCVPLVSGLFNSQNDIPLFLLNSQLTLLLELQSNPFIAFVDNDTNGGITSWTIDYVGLCYSQLEVDAEYTAALKQASMEGAVYTIPSTLVQCQNVATTSSINYLLSLSCNSLRSVHITNMTVPANQHSKMYWTAQGQTLLNIYADSILLNQVGNLDSTLYCANVFKESRRAFLGSSVDDPNISFAVDTSIGFGGSGYVAQNDSTCAYLSKVFVAGVSAECYHEGGYCMTGTPCQLLRLEWQGSNSITGNTSMYIVTVVDCLFSISGGVISVNK